MPLLLAKGASLNDPAARTPPLTLASIACDGAVVQALILRGAKANGPDAIGRTPLWIAGDSGNASAAEALLIRDLIRAGGNANARNAFGNTALMMAAGEGRAEAVKALTVAGADRSLRNKKREQAADVAASRGYASLASAPR